MKIGFDIRTIAYHNGSGLFTYSYNVLRELLLENSILNNIKDNENDKNEYYAYNICETKERKQIFNIEQIRISRNDNFWYEMYNSNWKHVNTNLDIFFNMTNGIGVPNGKYKKLFITVHDLIPYIYPESCDKAHLRYVFTKTPEIMYMADKIFTVSENSKNDIMRYFNIPENRIIVTYLAAGNEYKKMNKINANRYIKHKYGIDNNYILYVGGFSERKNIITLIRAYEILKKEYENEIHELKSIKLVILGKYSRTYDALHNETMKLKIEDDVIFPGYISNIDMPYFYNSALLLVYPSLYEGFGLPILEAMQCGLPVISADNSSIREIFKDSAILVESLNTYEYVEKMKEIIMSDKKRSELSKIGLEKAKEFSWGKAAKIIQYEIIKEKYK